jgi:hypothetical protein
MAHTIDLTCTLNHDLMQHMIRISNMPSKGPWVEVSKIFHDASKHYMKYLDSRNYRRKDEKATVHHVNEAYLEDYVVDFNIGDIVRICHTTNTHYIVKYNDGANGDRELPNSCLSLMKCGHTVSNTNWCIHINLPRSISRMLEDVGSFYYKPNMRTMKEFRKNFFRTKYKVNKAQYKDFTGMQRSLWETKTIIDDVTVDM